MSKPKRINGRTAHSYVQKRIAFKNSTGQLYAEWRDTRAGSFARYVVYSYGRHWPLFVYVPKVDTWFETKDRYSVTTSHHRTYAHPQCQTVPLSLFWMRVLELYGYDAMVQKRLAGDATGATTNG